MIKKIDIQAWVRASVVIIATALVFRYLGVQLPPPVVSPAAVCPCPCGK